MKEKETEKQETIKQKATDRIAPYMWKKGQSGNILGRPKGKTMKDWAREYLARMTDEERDEWMEGIPKEIVWKMSEGNPHTEDTLLLGELPQPILDVRPNQSDNQDKEPNQAN